MRQALAAAVILLLIAGVAGWLVLGNDDEAPLPTQDSDPRHESSPRGGDAEVERAPVEVPPATPDATGPEATDPAGPAVDPPAETPATPNVELVVLSSRTRAPIAVFRYTFRHRGPPVRGDGQDGDAAFALPPSRTGELSVEADGHVPFTAALTAPPPGAPRRTIDVFLDEAAIATGIVITAVDFDNVPVANVRVDAYRRPEQAGIGAWNRGTPLWSRRTAATDGRYVLPELPPADYGIRLLATDAEGELLPLLPFALTFKLTGSNGFVERAVLEPGCVFGLELVDPEGRPLDPERTAIEIALRQSGGPEVSRRWIQRNDTGRFAAKDAPPCPGTCWLDEAVPDGFYRLVISVDGEVRYNQPLTLRRSKRQQERIVVR